jgi:hypothetical protein
VHAEQSEDLIDVGEDEDGEVWKVVRVLTYRWSRTKEGRRAYRLRYICLPDESPATNSVMIGLCVGIDHRRKECCAVLFLQGGDLQPAQRGFCPGFPSESSDQITSRTTFARRASGLDLQL